MAIFFEIISMKPPKLFDISKKKGGVYELHAA